MPAQDTRGSHTVAVGPSAREITSRHRIHRRSLLPLAARRDASAAGTTFLDSRPAARTVVPLFATAMETIDTGYWKISSGAAINTYHCRRFHRVTPGMRRIQPYCSPEGFSAHRPLRPYSPSPVPGVNDAKSAFIYLISGAIESKANDSATHITGWARAVLNRRVQSIRSAAMRATRRRQSCPLSSFTTLI